MDFPLLPSRACRPLLFAVLAVAAAVPSAQVAAEGRLRVEVASQKSQYAPADAVAVEVRFSNVGSDPAPLARWMLEAGGIDASHLVVTQGGAVVPYLGARVKRRAPTSEDTITLAPGETRVAVFDLAAYFDLRAGGAFQVDLSPTLAARAGSPIDDRAASLATSAGFTVAARTERAGATATPAALAAAAPGECTANDREAIATSVNAARNYVRDSLRYLAGTVPLGERYTWWFGPNDSARLATVTTTYTNMLQKFDARAPRYSCSPSACGSGVFAYVFPSDSTHTVHLCSAFWAAAFTGTDSRAGTLVHEMSHFNTVGATDDWAYGQTAAHALVTSGNYAQAINNADTHEYFAENTPARP